MKFSKIKNLFFVVPFGILLAGCSPTIQRTVNVTKNISSTEAFGIYGSTFNLLGEDLIYKKANKYSLSKECLNYSISQEDLDKALENGAKIITSSQWEQVVLYTSYTNDSETGRKTGKNSYYDIPPIVDRTNQKGKCLGLSYIIEGKKSLLNKFAPKK
tara:strand:- start:210 stop:683 length:474 start_codon:yes stop_codon:yes gene_type:complete